LKKLLFLSTADTDLLTILHVKDSLPEDFGDIEVANVSKLDKKFYKDLDERLNSYWAICGRLLGGKRAIGDYMDQLAKHCRDKAVPLLLWPGEKDSDIELERLSTVGPRVLAQLGLYLSYGGVENIKNMLLALANELRNTQFTIAPPVRTPAYGIYFEGKLVNKEQFLAATGARRPVIGVAFYRAHYLSGNTSFIDTLAQAIKEKGAVPLCFFCPTLRDTDPIVSSLLDEILYEGNEPIVDCLISTLSFAFGKYEQANQGTVEAGWLRKLNVPILQAIIVTSPKENWIDSSMGLMPLDVAMQIALPEYDGRIITVPISFKQQSNDASIYIPDEERCKRLAGLAVNWAKLRLKDKEQKRVAIVLSSYPTKNARVGNAVGLDTPESAHKLLCALLDTGYKVENLPKDGQTLVLELINSGTYDRQHLTSQQIVNAQGCLGTDKYMKVFNELPVFVKTRLQQSWGDPPGEHYVYGDRFIFCGRQYGNVFVCVQPPRGYGENPIAIYHDPELPPTHHYVAFYRWLDEIFGADVIVHLGKHGTIEWLPGKSLALSNLCFTDLLQAEKPLVYPFIVNDPGEGIQAKRRARALIIDHLIPPMVRAETYAELVQLEQLLDEYYQIQTLDPSKLEFIRHEIWELITDINLHKDLGVESLPDNFDEFLLHVDGYLCELKDAQIRGGLHILGSVPSGKNLVELIVEVCRRENEGVPSLISALSELLGQDLNEQKDVRKAKLFGTPLFNLAERLNVDTTDATFGADLVNAVSLRIVEILLEKGAEYVANMIGASKSSALYKLLVYIGESLLPRLKQTSLEIDNVLAALDGNFIPPGPSGAPTRGMAHVLPTGRNFYSVDPRAIPSELSYKVGCKLAEATLARYVKEHGLYPETVGVIVWGTSVMRTQGDDVSQILAYLGVRPEWDLESRRVTGLKVIPLSELGRPRIDVVARVSGLFRDAFPNLIRLIDEAFKIVAHLDEPFDMNFVAKHFRNEVTTKRTAGIDPRIAERTSLYRIFGSPPGAYGSGVYPLLDAGNWQSIDDIARVYEAWGCYAYTAEEYGVDAVPEFRKRFSAIDIAIKAQDNREHDILDSDDYFQYHGGMIATVRSLTGRSPSQYHVDTSDPEKLRVRSLGEEIRYVLRTRAFNPRWKNAMKQHGYKGGLEILATVEYLFGFDATADVADDWIYEQLAKNYALDPDMQAFLKEKNPWALESIIQKLFEAAARGMWENPDESLVKQLRKVLSEVDAYIEGLESV